MKPPVETLHLYPVLSEKLIFFLKQLSPADWKKQTVARQWLLKDVAAHLLDGNYRRISLHRDGWMAPPEVDIHSYEDLVGYLNGLNADWVKATRRLSPAVIIELLETTNELVLKEFLKLDPFAAAAYAVNWAGEANSANWFDIAREYTERWLHQQQMRDAVNDNGIMTRELYQPFLNIFMYAWPHTMKEVAAAEGTVLKTTVAGMGEWFLRRERDGWQQSAVGGNVIAAETIIDSDIAWKLFSKSMRKGDVKGKVEVKGDEYLGGKVLDMISVMA